MHLSFSLLPFIPYTDKQLPHAVTGLEAGNFSVQFFDPVTFRSWSLIKPRASRGQNRPKGTRATIFYVPSADLHRFPNTGRHTTAGYLTRTGTNNTNNIFGRIFMSFLVIPIPTRGQQRDGEPNLTVPVFHQFRRLRKRFDRLSLVDRHFRRRPSPPRGTIARSGSSQSSGIPST